MMCDCLICNGTYTVGKVLVMSKTGLKDTYQKLCKNHQELIDAGLEAEQVAQAVAVDPDNWGVNW